MTSIQYIWYSYSVWWWPDDCCSLRLLLTLLFPIITIIFIHYHFNHPAEIIISMQYLIYSTLFLSADYSIYSVRYYFLLKVVLRWPIFWLFLLIFYWCVLLTILWWPTDDSIPQRLCSFWPVRYCQCCPCWLYIIIVLIHPESIIWYSLRLMTILRHLT